MLGRLVRQLNDYLVVLASLPIKAVEGYYLELNKIPKVSGVLVR
jgi:hypothetical protein